MRIGTFKTRMFIVKVMDDGTTQHYDKIEDVYMNCEGIDVNAGMYEFSDVEGNIYDIEWIEKIKTGKFFGLLSWSGQGKYRLKKRD